MTITKIRKILKQPAPEEIEMTTFFHDDQDYCEVTQPPIACFVHITTTRATFPVCMPDNTPFVLTTKHLLLLALLIYSQNIKHLSQALSNKPFLPTSSLTIHEAYFLMLVATFASLSRHSEKLGTTSLKNTLLQPPVSTPPGPSLGMEGHNIRPPTVYSLKMT